MSLEALFDASLDPDQEKRSEAERLLSTEATSTQLVHFIETSTNQAQRLSALVYLKNHILHHWSTQFAEFQGPLYPEDQRHAMRHECFKLLGDSNRPVRSQAGFIVSKLISSDYPDEWATVLDDLISILAKPPSENWLQGSLVVMKDFVDDSMSEEQFLPTAQNLVQYLLFITRNQHYPGGIRAQAIDVFMSCLDALEMLSSTRREGIRIFVDNALPPWLETIVSIINSQDSHPDCKSKAIETILKLRLLFPSQLVHYLPAIFTPVYESLQGIDIHDDDHNSKSTELQIEFLRKAVQAKIIAEETLANRPIFEGCVALSLKFAQITPLQSDEWLADLDGFVEDLEETSFSTRHLCTDLLEDMQKIQPAWTSELLDSAVSHYFSKATNSEHITREQEAVIFILIALTVEVSAVQQVLEISLSSSDPFLAGRGALYAAQLGVSECFESTCVLLGSQNIVARLCAIKAISKYADTQESLVKAQQASVLASMTAGISTAPASALLMMAESIGPVILLDPNIVLSPESPLPGLFTLLAGNPGDISLVSTVVDIFETLAGSVDFASLCNSVLPVLFHTISTEASLRPIAFDILNGIIEGSDKDLPNGFVDTLWPAFRIDMEIEEQQTVHEILRNLVTKSWNQIVAGDHVDELLNIIASAFANADESLSFYVPQLVISLIRQSGDLLATIMPKLLEIIVNQLRNPSLSTAYQQNLISVFAEIAVTQARPLIEFLKMLEGLQVVMSTWCEVFSDFHGYASIRTSVVGLAQIYAANLPDVRQTFVKGDLIPDTSGKILTRSRAKSNPDRYTSVSLNVKIIKLFLAELMNEMEGRTEDEEAVSDDEWDSTDISKIVEEAELNEEGFSKDDEDDKLKDINTRQYITDFLKSHFVATSQSEVQSQLSVGEQEVLQGVLQA